jgi:outer membrane protein assembly factor BamE (lipoprotein component of BamABCDE complex)
MYRLLLALSLLASTSQAQTGVAIAGATSADGTIDPGMTKAQVIEKLGKPATVRNYQGSTYLMYSNKCGKACGMQDIVILDHDVVVDAVFRSPNRHYTGTSSSPEATKANSRTQRNESLAVPAAEPTAAERVAPSMTHAPADSTQTLTSHAPADSARTSTTSPPADSVRTPTSRPPADSAPVSQANPQAPYGKPPTTPPPADSAASTMSHPPVDNSATSTAHPPKPPK